MGRRRGLNGIKSVPGAAKAIVLTSENPTDENSLAEPTKIAPVTEIINVKASGFQHAFPGNSLTVFRLRVE